MNINKSYDTELTAKIKDFALDTGADMVGFADAEKLKRAPEGHRPGDHIPEASVVIVMAIRQSQTLIKYGKSSPYTRHIFSSSTFLDQVLSPQVTKYLEDYGYRAVPIASNNPQAVKNFGDISHKHAAVQAGLGEMGLNTLLITPRYGNRVFLTSVITDAPLVPDRPYEGILCNKCGKCVRACPVRALDGEGGIDKNKCRPYQQVPPEKVPDSFCIETFGMKNCWDCRKVCDAVTDLV